MFRKAFGNKTLVRFASSCMKFGWLFLIVFYTQIKTQNQQNSDLQLQEPRTAQESQLKGLQKAFGAFLEKCVDNEFYDQIMAHLNDLFLIIKDKIKNNNSSEIVSTNSTVARSKISKIVSLLATDTQNDLLKDLQNFYFVISKIFGWEKQVEKTLFATYKRKRRWHILKEFKDSSFFIILSMFGTISGAIFSFFKLNKLALNTTNYIFWEPNGEKAVGEQTTFTSKGKTDDSQETKTTVEVIENDQSHGGKSEKIL